VGPAGTTEFGYDADGNRVQRSVNGATSRFLVDAMITGLSQPLEERDGAGALIAHHTYGHRRLSTTNGSTSAFYHHDALGSTRLLTDGTGSVTDTYDYDGYGGLVSASGATNPPYLFTGERFEPSVGLYDLRARNYSPAVGRFLGRDPAAPKRGDPRSAHPFLYAHADPVNLTDPTGRSTTLVEQMQVVAQYGLQTVADCGVKVAQGCRLKGLAEGYAQVAGLAVIGVTAALAFDLAQAITSDDHNLFAVPPTGLVILSSDWRMKGPERGVKKVEYRVFYKPGLKGLWNPIEGRPAEGQSDWKFTAAIDFVSKSKKEVKLRGGYEWRSQRASIEAGFNKGFSMSVCGVLEFFKVELAVRGGLSESPTKGLSIGASLGLEATLIKLIKFQYPILPPTSSTAGQ
jgi:RHS repeat-associated protein